MVNVKAIDKGTVGVQHLYVKGRLYEHKVNAFIDSGSSVSLVSTEFIKMKRLWENVRGSDILIRSFSKDKIPIDGVIELEVQLTGKTIKHTFLVSRYVEFELLIGLDYLTAAGIIIDIPGKCLKAGNSKTMFMQRPSSITRIAKIRLANNEILEPGTANCIEAKMPGHRTEPTDRYGLFLGKDDPKRFNLVIADSVNYTEGYRFKVQVYNMGTKVVKLNKGDIIGKMCPLVIDNEIFSVHKVMNQTNESEGVCNNIQNESEKEWTKDNLFKELEVSEMKLNESERCELKELVWKYRKCFSKNSGDLGKCNIFEAHIELKPDAKPKWMGSRPVPYKLKSVMEKQIETQLKAGVIERYEGNSGFNSSVMLVKKPKSDEWRGVVDLRYVNSMSVPDRYEMPNMMNVLDQVGKANYLSTLDITSAFNQVPLSKESRPITAFSYNKQRYIYKVLVMGFLNSSAIFCRIMDKIFKDSPYKSILTFLDDLIMSSKTVKEHLERLEYIFKRMMEVNLKFRPSKCKLFRNEVSFVGYKISKKGIQIDNARIEPILNLKAPTNRREVQSIIGVLNFQRNFIKDFAEMARPLYKLLKKENRFNWTTECQKSFDALKKAMTSAPILKIQDLDDTDNSYCVEVDSSGLAWGAVLSQGKGTNRQVVAYYSKCIPEYKRRQGASRLEFLGMYHALRHWRMYLWGNDVEVVTDCEALVNLETLFHRSSTVQQRQMLELADYRLTIRHVKGSLNVIPDFLSRYIAGNKVTVGTQTENRAINIDPKRIYKIKIDDIKKHMIDFEPVKIKTTKDQNSSEKINSVPRVVCENLVRGRTFLETVHEGMILNTAEPMYEVCTVKEEVESLKEDDVIYDQYPKDHEVKIVTIEDLRQATLDDDVLREVVKWLKLGVKPKQVQASETPKELISLWKSFDKLSYHNGIIYLSWSMLKPPFKERELIVVPYVLQERMLINFHCGLLSLHMGVEACYNNCVKKFWWSKMKKEFKLFIAACIKCQKNKQPKAYLKAPLKPTLYTAVGDGIAIDHLIPSKLGKSTEGFRYILTIVEGFSNYLICVPVKTMTAKETIKCIIQHYILPFGCPLKIVSDNYPSLTSELFKETMKQFGIVDRKVTPYMSQSNGKCEIQNKRIGAALRAVVPENELRTWSKYVPYCTSALNCMKSKSTGFSANFIMFGRELRFPNEFFVDQEIANRNNEADSWVPVKTKTYELYRLIRNIYYKVRKNSKRQAKYMKTEYDKGVRMKEFKPGDHVFVFKDGNKHKLGPRWVGPARVMKKLSVHNYIVLIDPVNELYKSVSIQKLKEYKPNYYSPILKRVNNSNYGRKEITTVNMKADSLIDEGEERVFIKESIRTPVQVQVNRPVIDQQPRAINPSSDTVRSSSGVQQDPVQGPSAIDLSFEAIDPPARERRPREAHNKARKPFPQGFQLKE